MVSVEIAKAEKSCTAWFRSRTLICLTKKTKKSIIDKNENILIVIGTICFVVFSFARQAYLLSPKLHEFRNSIFGLIIDCAFVVSIISFFIFSKTIDQPLLGKITTASYAVIYILLSVIDIGKFEPFIYLLYSVVNISIVIYIYKKTERVYISIWILGAYAYLSTIIFEFKVECITGDFNPTFLIPSIIITVIVFLLCLIFAILKYKKSKSLQIAIFIPLMGLISGFIISWTTISSMNIYLDFSSPTYVEFVIIDKKLKSGARQATTYELEVKNENESFAIAVSENAYYEHEINDTIVLSLYNGAFNEPYYIHDNK